LSAEINDDYQFLAHICISFPPGNDAPKISLGAL
jgi:hypothetical protein